MPESIDHYGVKGMRWGHRKDTYSKTSKTEKSTDEQRKARNKKRALVAAGVVTALAASYAAYTLVDSGEARRLASKGAAFISKNSFAFKKDERLSGKMSINDIMDKVVPDVNPGYKKEAGTVNNCRRCTYAYLMRRKGFDVSATKTQSGRGQSFYAAKIATEPSTTKAAYPTGRAYVTSKLFKDAVTVEGGVLNSELYKSSFGKNKAERDLNSAMAETAKKKGWGNALLNALSKQPEGSIGEVDWRWNNRSGHSMAYEIINGEAFVIDAQTGTKYGTKSMEDRIKLAKLGLVASEVQLRRLDDADLNADFLMRWVKNADD